MSKGQFKQKIDNMQMHSGRALLENNTYINKANIIERQDLSTIHQQIINKNYYSYSSGNTATLPASSSNSYLYVYLENNTDKRILIYPGKITALTTSPSTDIFFRIERRNSNVSVDTTGQYKYTSENFGNLYESVVDGLDVWAVSQSNVINEGVEIPTLRSYVIGGEATTEEERGERYILQPGEKILAKIVNLTDKDLTVYVKSYWSFLDLEPR